jgi:hypothetical protein
MLRISDTCGRRLDTGILSLYPSPPPYMYPISSTLVYISLYQSRTPILPSLYARRGGEVKPLSRFIARYIRVRRVESVKP